MLRLITSTSAAARLDAVRRYLRARPPHAEVVIVGASRGAADDLAREIARDAGATFGITRFSFTELAARAASCHPTSGPHAPVTTTGGEAMAARAVFEAMTEGELAYFAPVASTPGFPRALGRTLHELRLAGVSADRLAGDVHSSLGETDRNALSDVGHLLSRVEKEIEEAGLSDRANLLRLAAEACRAGRVRWTRMPLVLLDVPLDSWAERGFAAALVGQALDVVATVPEFDQSARDALLAIGGTLEVVPDTAAADSDLANLRRFIFTMERPDARARAGDVQLFSAPGEAREAIEIVRRALDAAERGVPFDQMAVLLRAPQQYLGVLEHACMRGGVPAYFDRGTRLPDPGGRAFVALVACAVEGLSARRFDEYLSLAQVPRVAAAATETDAAVWPRADEFPGQRSDDSPEAFESDAPPAPDPASDSDDEAIVAGTLRSPWKWEELVVESAVVGGRSREEGKSRWRRRLNGLASDYGYRIAELEREEPESPALLRLQRDLRNLSHLRAFALPIVDMLAEWPDQAMWGEWLDRFAALASRALKQPIGVLQLLAELRPMAGVGPIGLEQAADVLRERLTTLDRQPPRSRYGRLFVGTPHQARGRSFRVVFVPGLAERLVPQRPREDPLLLDDRRRQLDAGLLEQDDRGSAERLLLRIAIGAAEERLHLSYPRLDVAEARARVPSFYALDVMRAITGSVPDHRALAVEAAEAAGAYLAWPAPADADRAIDDLEHDLASLRPLLGSRDPTVKGRAHYLLSLNDALRRSIVSRWSRSRRTWAPADGLIAPTPALERHRLGRRPYSLSALQRFASCPYQFLLATIHRLEPRQEPEPLLRMDPLTRGSLFHAVQAAFFRALEEVEQLPVTRATLPDALRTLDTVLAQVSGEYEERLAPAIDRVWRDEIADLRRDLGIWVQKLVDDDGWRPSYFELSFGLGEGLRPEHASSGGGVETGSHALRAPDPGAPRDPRSLPDPVVVDGRFILRGSVDLIERHRDVDVLRITDHKTGKNRTSDGLIVGGGAVLQPVLYGLAIEQGLGRKVMSGRLFYCTTAGGFTDRDIPLNDYTRGQGLQVLEIIDRAVADGFMVAAPAPRACTWCDFKPVCGPREEARVSLKAKDRLADLDALRSMR